MTYCIDTSSFLDAWDRWYPIDVFPSFWQKLGQFIEHGVVISSEEVYTEIERKHDELFEWVKARRSMFVELSDDVQDAVTTIMREFPQLVDARSGKSFADPFVIATAMVNDATVVTGEAYGTETRPKIPIVCDRFKVRHLQTVGLLRALGIAF